MVSTTPSRPLLKGRYHVKVSASTFLLLAGGLVVLAYLSESLLQQLRVPPVLLLILVGLALGPMTGVLPAERFREVAPHFGSLAFLLILFEGGLDLPLASLRQQWKGGGLLAFKALGFSVLLGLAFFSLCGRPWQESLLLAVALSPVSGSIVLPLMARLPAPGVVKTLATLEAALADVLALLAMEALFTLLQRGGWGTLLALGSVFAALFSVVVAVALGLLWPPLLRRLRGVPHADVLTFALAMVLWGAVEVTGAPGALAVLAFGVAMANENQVLAHLGLPQGAEQALVENTVERLHRFIQQLTFLVRTFFFVFLGVVVTGQGLSWEVILLSLGASLALLLARFWALFRPQGHFSSLTREERHLLWLLQPRGLVSAVLALRAMEEGLAGAWFLPVASVVIILTNFLLILALRSLPKPGEDAGPPTVLGEPPPGPFSPHAAPNLRQSDKPGV